MVDVTLFVAGIFVMYKWGKSMAETIDGYMPTEKNTLEMMKNAQGGMGGLPSPM